LKEEVTAARRAAEGAAADVARLQARADGAENQESELAAQLVAQQAAARKKEVQLEEAAAEKAKAEKEMDRMTEKIDKLEVGWVGWGDWGWRWGRRHARRGREVLGAAAERLCS
jgi:septal ring factor EnvC (AmiA/AmiB activator)